MYQKILVPLDGSGLAQCVLPHVEALAKLEKPEIELVMVVEPYEMPVHGGVVTDEDAIKRLNHQQSIAAENYLKETAGNLLDKGVVTKIVVLTGKIADSLVDYAANNDFNLIIMATHGRSGISRWIWGSVAEKILHASMVPVLLIRVCKHP